MGDLLFTLRVRLSDGLCIIRAFDNPNNRMCGSQRIDISVRMNGSDVFPLGLLYCGTPAAGGMSVDGIEAKELVLSLVGMKPGDTDTDYFADYTPEQLEWAQLYGEEISVERQYRYCDENGNVRRPNTIRKS